jgi:hypothetical protein
VLHGFLDVAQNRTVANSVGEVPAVPNAHTLHSSGAFSQAVAASGCTQQVGLCKNLFSQLCILLWSHPAGARPP